MAGSINKVILVGNLGNDPEIRSFQNGGRIANLSLATSESWKDRTTGERKEKTEWHRVVIFNSALVDLAEKYLHKGSKVYIEGKVETRSYETSSGEKKYATEIVLRPYAGEIQLLDKRENSYDNGGSSFAPSSSNSDTVTTSNNSAPVEDSFDDEIPF